MPSLAHLNITAIYAGLTALLLVFLSIRVTVARAKNKVELGDGGKPEMLRAIRLQGNLIEYAPMALILMALLELGGTAPWVLHAMGIVFIVARLIHATVDLSQKVGLRRGVGATATWVVVLAGGVLVLAMSQGMIVK
jgi:uncharacterized membrane protein YecN with MAPEG domain